MKAFVIILTLAALVGSSWFGYNRYFGGEKAPDFVFQRLDRGDVIRTVSATGDVEPLIKVVVGSQVSGNIVKWYADFNAKVSKDFILAEIDPERFKTNFDQAKANLTLARARADETHVRFLDAQRETNRIERLQSSNIASDNEFLVAKAASDAAEAVWKGALAGVELAQASVEAAQVDLDRTVIRSPIEGVVISRDIDVGQTVAASLQAPTLFTIANDLTQMQVNANVSEADVGLVREGMHATFTVDAYPRRTYEGTISQIRYNPTILDSVVTYVTLIDVQNEDLSLRPGMSANITFEVAKADDVIRIPNAALRFSPDPPGAVKVRRSAPMPTIYRLVAGKPVPVEVRIGISDGSFTELKSDNLTEGAEVITERNWSGAGRGRPDMTRTMRG